MSDQIFTWACRALRKGEFKCPRRSLGHFALAGEVRATLIRALVFTAVAVVACRQSQSTPAERSSEPHGIREEAVKFGSGKITLAGTLVLPEGEPKYPAVVLFHGSGAQKRDLSSARWFAEQGFAALAYDKRGVGKSDGDFRAVPLMELSADGLAGIEYLKSRRDIDTKHIGVWGLSQGGWLGPLAASRSPEVAFVIAVSGPGVSPGEQMIVYYANELRDRGMPESDVREASTVRRDIWNYMSTGRDYEKVRGELENARKRPWFGKAKTQVDDSFGRLPTPDQLSRQVGRSLIWFKQEAIYDPVPALRALRVPALFLFGDKDRLIPVEESIAIIKRVQAEDGGHDFTIREFPNDDHGMYLVSNSGDVAIDPEYLKTMREWLRAHVLKMP